jgi:chloramphenicol O-acetyltransferase type A
MKIIDPSTCKRKGYFDFFSHFDDPFYGIVSEIDCTNAYQFAKAENRSFFSHYLHKSLLAVNEIEEFRYRAEGDKIILFDKIHATSTIAREDGSFGFSFIPFNFDFKIFDQSLKKEIKNVQDATGIRANAETSRNDVIHYSSIPWVKFTGLTHPRNFKAQDSIPKITFGKAFPNGEKKIMPVSINAHHGFVDGLHLAKYLELFQKFMDDAN